MPNNQAPPLTPDELATIFPPLTDLRPREGDFFVGDLPPVRLAADLAAEGVTYRRGVGYALAGEPVEAAEIALLGATILHRYAALTPAHRVVIDHPLFPWTPEDRREMENAPHPLRSALSKTARTLRRSRPARSLFVELVRPHLPAPAPVGADAADAWLAVLDSTPYVLRAQLHRDYVAAGAPGGLTKGELFARARARWGDPTHSGHRGGTIYTPAARTARSGPDLEAIARLIGVPADALATLIAEHSAPTPQEPIA